MSGLGGCSDILPQAMTERPGEIKASCRCQYGWRMTGTPLPFNQKTCYDISTHIITETYNWSEKGG